MKDSQARKLTRVVRKLAAEVAALRKLIRRELLKKDGKAEVRKRKKKEAGKKGRKEHDSPAPANPNPSA
jgi:hypothetical protein